MIDLNRLAEQIYFSVLAHGKATYPDITSGYAVKNLGTKTIYPMASVSPRSIANYMQYNFVMTNAELMGNVFTIQLSPDKKFAILDVVTIVPDRTEAFMLTLARGSMAFFDLDNNNAVLIKVIGTDEKYG